MLDLDPNNVKALYRRGQSNTNMKDFEQAMVCSPGEGTLGIFGWWSTAETREPLAYTRARSSEFCCPILG